jgi:hypothetical protein
MLINWIKVKRYIWPRLSWLIGEVIEIIIKIIGLHSVMDRLPKYSISSKLFFLLSFSSSPEIKLISPICSSYNFYP